AYVFGGAIKLTGVNYREYLMAGIFTQTVAFGAGITAIGLADDLQKGIIDRFRSLPMSRAAVLIGRTTSDLLNNLLVVVVMGACGAPPRPWGGARAPSPPPGPGCCCRDRGPPPPGPSPSRRRPRGPAARRPAAGGGAPARGAPRRAGRNRAGYRTVVVRDGRR